jgi:hypothetical protein
LRNSGIVLFFLLQIANDISYIGDSFAITAATSSSC